MAPLDQNLENVTEHHIEETLERGSENGTRRFAWATLVMDNDSYACGALVLACSLREKGTAADLVCMVTDTVAQDVLSALHEFFDFVVMVPKIEAKRGVFQRDQVRFGHMYRPWLANCLTKFCVLAMAQFDKVAFLDADMVCVGDQPDELFKCNAPAGILDLYKSDVAKNDQMHGRKVPQEDLRQSLARNFYGIRGCLLLLTPDEGDFASVLHAASSLPIGSSTAMAGPDEHFATLLFGRKAATGRGRRERTWTHLHIRFGCVSWKVPELLGAGTPPVFLHYVSEKPWHGPPAPPPALTTSIQAPLVAATLPPPAAAAAPSAPAAAPAVTCNWADFAQWDAVAERVVHLLEEGGEDCNSTERGELQTVSKRLFAGWKQRRKLVYVSGSME